MVTKTRTKATITRKKPAAGASPDAQERVRRIAIAAYYRAQARGFLPGHEVEDWLEAERQIDAEDRTARAPAIPKKRRSGRTAS